MRQIETNTQGHLVLGGCDTSELVETYGTPLYVMDEQIIRRNMRACVQAMAACFDKYQVYFASKAFSSIAVGKIAQSEGVGIDVVSAGELATALKAGFTPDMIHLHGNAKTDEEIAMAVQCGCAIVVDGLDELPVIDSECEKQGKTVQVSLRIAPGIDAHTHEYIKTGTLDSKFSLSVENGMAIQAMRHILQSDYMEFSGIHCHIGSQILASDAFDETGVRMAELALEIENQTGAFPAQINIGGGFGIRYIEGDNPLPMETYIRAAHDGLKKTLDAAGKPMPEIGLEPGRFIVGEAGTTLYTVMGVKDVPGVRIFVAVDGSMADNPRVALYQAEYEAVCANKANEKPTQVVSLAGRCCETDMLIYDIEMPAMQRGDTVAVFATGAYNYAMASNYNKLPIPPVVLVNEGRHALMVRGQTVEEMYARDEQPSWLK